MSDAQSFLQAMYKEQCDQARQHENMRQQSTTLVLTLCSMITVLSTASASWLGPNQHYKATAIVLISAGVLVAALGCFGRTFSLKHYERNRMHTTRAGNYRRRLESLFLEADYGCGLRGAAQEEHVSDSKKNSPDRSGKVIGARLYQSWMALYWFVIALGAVLSAAGILIGIFSASSLGTTITKLLGK